MGLEANGPSHGRTPSTPGRLQASRPDTPSRSDSRQELDRASTPLPLDKDEKDEFLRRENELQDQLTEKESNLAKAEQGWKDAREELQLLKDHDSRAINDIEKLNTELNELRMQLQKINFENNDAQITMDSLKEANGELTAELDEYKQQLLDAKMSARDNGVGFDEKERVKRERMAEMMAGFDIGSDALGKSDRRISDVIEQLAAIEDPHDASAINLHELRGRLIETQDIVRQTEAAMLHQSERDEASVLERLALEKKLSSLQAEYEHALERSLNPQDVGEIKRALAQSYAEKMNGEGDRIDELEQLCRQRVEDNNRLREEIVSMQQKLAMSSASASVGHTSNGTANGKTLQQQITEFDAMKKNLMRDLQNRCERVVELEISLDETREQYNNVLRTSNNRAQQKKMAFLERNLEQLTVVQRQLVEQNSSLKKEVAIAERKLIARNERIQSLEHLLGDSQEKLTAANHKFELQLMQVKERLEAAKAGSTRGLGGPGALDQGAFGGSRIAKPLRGGQAVESMGQIPAVSALQGSGSSKRTSWFFNQRS